MYFVDRNSLRDALSETRDKLKGEWQVKYYSYELQYNGWQRREFQSKVTIELNDIYKLQFLLDMAETDYFSSAKVQIEHITISTKKVNERSIVFFYETPNKVKEGQKGILRQDQFPGRYVVHATFQETTGNINKMEGEWVDIDRVLAQCHQSALSYLEMNGGSAVPSSVGIPADFYKGSIKFER